MMPRIFIALLVATTSFCVPVAHSEEQMILGPRQFARETGGRGAVLCVWALYLEVRAAAKECNFPREPFDDFLDEAILAIDEFIIENSSLHPTRKMVEDFKRRAETSFVEDARRRGILTQICKNNPDHFRSEFRKTPESFRDSVKSLLSVPREPVMNPCL